MLKRKNPESENEEERLCINCEYATHLKNTDNCVCTKKGIVRADGSCKKYKLDLLKIVPDGDYAQN